MIRTSKLSNKFINKNKKHNLERFIDQYKNVVQDWIDILWSRLSETYECPKFVVTKNYKKYNLSQRAIKCASTQACGMIKAATARKQKLLWMKSKFIEENKDLAWINKEIEKAKVVKPTLPSNFKCELNSICCDLRKENNFWFLQLKCIGKEFGKIRIPVKPHRQTLKWLKQGKLLSSFLVSENFIDVRFEIKRDKLKHDGIVVGLDQGISNCIALSDGQKSQDDNHNWNLSKILSKLSKKKKGSKGFKRTQEHRKNYINWCINQLNLSNIKQINLEKIKNLRKGKKTDRFRSHWTYTLIRDKLIRFCEEQKVSVKEQSCIYRSQRCYQCGLVRKEQRKGKVYNCKCGYINDSDLNASLNHEIELPRVDFLRHLGHNIGGCYWNPNGIYDLNGKELTVPCTIKNKLSNCTWEPLKRDFIKK